MSENKKNVPANPELPDEELDAVSGGYKPTAQAEVLIDVITTADTVCKKCGKTFSYEYYWMGGMHDGPWNHPVPDLCPDCDPEVMHDR